MNSRRQFLQKGSLAATALLLAGGAKSFAGTSFFFGSDDNNLSILHSHLPVNNDVSFFSDHGHIKDIISTEKRKFNNLLMVDDSTTAGKAYNIVIKGKIRSGIINTNHDGGMSIDAINNLAHTLKKEKRCNIVICVIENKIDDQKLAKSSEHIDVIIGHGATPDHLPSIVLNKNKQEVLINHCSAEAVAVGRISIRFDKNGAKNGMTFSNVVFRDNKEVRRGYSLS